VHHAYCTDVAKIIFCDCVLKLVQLWLLFSIYDSELVPSGSSRSRMATLCFASLRIRENIIFTNHDVIATMKICPNALPFHLALL